ncbi:MAG: transporter substrate-binding domain-containing protein [Spirochaetaceae bacterium]|nr:transporter substrate-binding domain-containing protein [Spirochaetaceae bacterium]
MSNCKTGSGGGKNKKSPRRLRKILLKIRCAWAVLFIPLGWSCTQNSPPAPRTAYQGPVSTRYPRYNSYREIPGVTQEEIDAIEAFRRADRIFVYGMVNSMECFKGPAGPGGYAALFCRLLSDLFGIRFKPELREWNQLMADLDSGRVDFTGELSPTPERLKKYKMTEPIAERIIVVTTLKDRPSPMTAGARFGFMEGTTTRNLAGPSLGYDFEAVPIKTVDEAYGMLRGGTLDAFFWELQDALLEEYRDLKTEPFVPFIYSAVSMAAVQPELEPVISVVQKYLDQGLFYHLMELYRQGRRDFLSYRFDFSLTEEERLYVEDQSKKGPIPLLIETDNYPVAFYNPAEQKWQGIAWDILEEISAISGLRFEVINSTGASWAETMAAMEQGRAAMITELIRTAGRDGRFLWGESYSSDNYALISRVEQQNIEINDIPSFRVGFARDTAYMETFKRLFPRHPNAVEYPSIKLALAALERNEIDLLMGTENMVLSLTNYLEKPGFKANLIFDVEFDSAFGFNQKEETLRAVVGKAQALVNTGTIVRLWQSRVFDYRDAVIRFRQPYLILLSILFGAVIILLAALLKKFHESRHKLEIMVGERTKELEIQKNAVQTAYNVKNYFLANMSHELRTPLNAIIGLSQMELERGHGQSRDNLRVINHSGVILLNIVNDLLDISSLESGKITLSPADYSLPAFISELSNSARLFIGKKQIEFFLEVNENLPRKLHGDKQRISQIVNNLLSNAAKFTPCGRIVLRVDLEKPDQDRGGILLVFEVRDTGIGIESSHMEKLFTDYGQADTSTSRCAGGTGMGLLIVKNLAQMMGGTVHAASEFGRGSVFTAALFQAVADPSPWDRDTAERLRTFTWTETPREKPCLSYARVLVVDDVPTNHAVVRGMMKPYKIAVDAVSSGQEAVDLMARADVRYDAIFMDHMMPGMDGLEAAIRIRGLDTGYARTIPIIALTANALSENEDLFLKNGFNAFMTKPISAGTLHNMLLDWVRDKDKEKNLAKDTPEKSPAPEKSGTAGKTLRLEKYTVPGVDLAAGAAQFGDEETYLEIVKVFVKDTPKLLDNIQKCIDGFRIVSAAATLEAIKNYTILVHGIKGSCYGICATPVGDMAKELETLAKARDFARVVELNTAFVGTVERLIKELKRILPQDKPRTERPAPDPRLLQKVLAGARSYNIGEILDTVKELDRYTYREGGTLVHDLRIAAENYEYAEIVTLLSSPGEQPQDPDP